MCKPGLQPGPFFFTPANRVTLAETKLMRCERGGIPADDGILSTFPATFPRFSPSKE